MDEWMVKEGMT